MVDLYVWEFVFGGVGIFPEKKNKKYLNIIKIMKTKYKILFLLQLVCSFAITAQSPELVQDFNSGEEDGFNKFNIQSIELSNRLIFPIVSSDFGEELGVLENGQLSLLKDINEGAESSQPNNFVQFKDKIYFSAFDEINGGGIWTTDGTTENTELLFSLDADSNSRPYGLITSASDYLYFAYQDSLFRTDGITREGIYKSENFGGSLEILSTQYENEIAFLTAGNGGIKLYKVENGSPVLLAEVDEADSFADILGLSQVNQGLIFAVLDDFNEEFSGIYFYDPTDNSLEMTLIGDSYPLRLKEFTNNQSLALILGEGYYTTNGVEGDEELLFSTNDFSLTQFDPVGYGVYEDKMILYATDGFFDDFILYTDGTTVGTTQLFEINSSHISNFLMHDKYAFFASGISNGFTPELYYVQMEDGSFNNFFTFSESSLNIDSVLPLGVQDNKLYFTSNLDSSIGRELYSIELDIPIDTETPNAPSILVEFTSQSYKIVSDGFSKAIVDTYTVDGKLVESNTVMTNSVYDLSHLKQDIYLLRFQLNNQIYTHKYISPK